MSYAMKAARAGNMGDPGLFGFIGSAIKTIAKPLIGSAVGFATGGPGGAIMGAARTLLPQAKPIKQAILTSGSPLFQPIGTAMPGSGVSIGRDGVQVGTFPSTSRPGLGITPGVTGPLVGSPAAGQNGTKPCASGYHYNKGGYYTKRYGFVERGTVCVKNRKRNPLNPRALSRAMARVKSAQNAVRCLSLFAGPAARASAKKKSGRGGCRTGCKKR